MKRSHDELESAELQALAENADELIAALESLKKNSSKAPKKLRKASRKILPALESLAAGQDDEEEMPPSPKKSKIDPSGESPSQPDAPTTVNLTLRLRPWEPSRMDPALPPLPKVLNPQLEQAAFTHSGFAGTSENYERLEFLGDAFLELIASLLIYSTFPDLSPGRCSHIRELLVRNATLAAIFDKYDLMSRARIPEAAMELKKSKVKIKGDVIEAYTAAIILSDPENGFERAADWLRDIWVQEIRPELRQLARVGEGVVDAKGQELPPKVTLGNLIVLPRCTSLRYEEIDKVKKDPRNGLPLFGVKAVFDGWGEKNVLLGTGWGKSKNEAGHKAAEFAISQNSKLVKKFEAKKRAVVEKSEENAGGS